MPCDNGEEDAAITAQFIALMNRPAHQRPPEFEAIKSLLLQKSLTDSDISLDQCSFG